MFEQRNVSDQSQELLLAPRESLERGIYFIDIISATYHTGAFAPTQSVKKGMCSTSIISLVFHRGALPPLLDLGTAYEFN